MTCSDLCPSDQQLTNVIWKLAQRLQNSPNLGEKKSINEHSNFIHGGWQCGVNSRVFLPGPHIMQPRILREPSNAIGVVPHIHDV